MKTFSAYVEWDPETKLYIGIVPGIPGAHTQAATLDELQTSLREVLELCLGEFKGSLDGLPHSVGLQQIEVAVRSGCRSCGSAKWREFFTTLGLKRRDKKEVMDSIAIRMAARRQFPIIPGALFASCWAVGKKGLFAFGDV